VVNGTYAFNDVPFGMTLVIEATAPGFARFEQTLTVSKGAMVRLPIQLQKVP
jgi:hypothetical protein